MNSSGFTRHAVVAATLLALGACGDDSLSSIGDDGVGKGTPQGGAGTGCETSLDCVPGSVCRAGACEESCVGAACDAGGGPGTGDDSPGGSSDGGGGAGVPPLVGGQWSSEYHFDWSDYLGPLAGLGAPLDSIDQILIGNTNLANLPIAGALLQDFIEQYIPPWVGDLVHLLNGVVHFFQDVRIDGRLALSHAPDVLTTVNASEHLSWGYVTVIDGCDLGLQDPAYPDCALVTIPLNNYVADFGTIVATAEPFSGSLVQGGTGAWSIEFQQREIEIELGKFLKYVLDRLTQIATNGQHATLATALGAAVNCDGFATAVHNFMCNTFAYCSGQALAEGACYEGLEYAAGLLEEQLLRVSVDWELMRFEQNAPVRYDASNGYASGLGSQATPGAIENGEFDILIDAELSGNWRAWR